MARSYKRARTTGRTSGGGLTWKTVAAAARWAQRARRAVRSAAPLRQAASDYNNLIMNEPRRTRTSVSMGGTRMRRESGGKRYVTTGKVGKKFARAKKKLFNKFIKEGAVIKFEAGGLADGTECVYVGHYSLPLNRVLSCATYALARRVMAAMDIYVQDPLEPTFYQHALDIFIDYRNNVGGQILFSAATPLAANFTLAAFGDAIGTRIASLYTNSYMEVVKFRILDSVTGDTLFQCNGSNIWFDIVGNSNMQLQNRTLANNTTEPNRFNANDITNNPLRGKRYDGVCNQHVLKFVENVAVPGPVPSLYYDNSTGVLALSSTDAAFTPAIQQSLKKPPLRSAFSNALKSKYTQLLPGEIRRSNVKSSMNIGLNGLLATYGVAIRTAPNMFSLANAMVMKGRNSLYAFEKLCDTGSSTEASGISVGYETVSTVSAVCYVKKKVNMNPYVLPI